MSEWQPIETAPKDGTPILVWDGVDYSCVQYLIRKDGSAFWELGHGMNGDRSFLLRTLLNWMPLPEPPA